MSRSREKVSTQALLITLDELCRSAITVFVDSAADRGAAPVSIAASVCLATDAQPSIITTIIIIVIVIAVRWRYSCSTRIHIHTLQKRRGSRRWDQSSAAPTTNTCLNSLCIYILDDTHAPGGWGCATHVRWMTGATADSQRQRLEEDVRRSQREREGGRDVPYRPIGATTIATCCAVPWRRALWESTLNTGWLADPHLELPNNNRSRHCLGTVQHHHHHRRSFRRLPPIIHVNSGTPDRCDG